MTDLIVTAPLWRWTGGNASGSWHFLTLSGDAGEALHVAAIEQRMVTGKRAGWGSLRVTAQIGDTRWATSVFPSRAEGGWLLPVKAAVRKAEGLGEGDAVRVTLTV